MLLLNHAILLSEWDQNPSKWAEIHSRVNFCTASGPNLNYLAISAKQNRNWQLRNTMSPLCRPWDSILILKFWGQFYLPYAYYFPLWICLNARIHMLCPSWKGGSLLYSMRALAQVLKEGLGEMSHPLCLFE